MSFEIRRWFSKIRGRGCCKNVAGPFSGVKHAQMSADSMHFTPIMIMSFQIKDSTAKT